jgi:hypothetical protein
MNIIELIGFLIAMAALTFLYFKRLQDEKYRREHPEEFEQKQEEERRALKEIFKEMHIDLEEEEEEFVEKVPPPPPPPRAPVPIKTPVFKKKRDAYTIHAEKERAHHPLLKKLSSPKEMVLYHEILGPPKSERRDGF